MASNFDAKAFAENLVVGQQSPDTSEPPVQEGNADESSSYEEPQENSGVGNEAEGESSSEGSGQVAGESSQSSDARSQDDTRTQQSDESQQTVPLPVVVQQRQEISQLKSALQQMYGELQRVQQQQQPKAEEQLPPEDLSFKPSVKFDEDPNQFLYEQNAWLQKQLGLVAQHVQGLYQNGMEQKQQQESISKQKAQEEQFQNYVQSLEHAYASSNPHYSDAVTFLRGKRLAELEGQIRAMGRDPSDPAIAKDLRKHVVAEFTNYARSVVSQQGNPAEALYRYAEAVGFKPEQKEQQQQSKSPPPDNSQYERAKRGQDASMSAASMPGNAPGDAGSDNQPQTNSFGSIADALRAQLYGKH